MVKSPSGEYVILFFRFPSNSKLCRMPARGASGGLKMKQSMLSSMLIPSCLWTNSALAIWLRPATIHTVIHRVWIDPCPLDQAWVTLWWSNNFILQGWLERQYWSSEIFTLASLPLPEPPPPKMNLGASSNPFCAKMNLAASSDSILQGYPKCAKWRPETSLCKACSSQGPKLNSLASRSFIL